MKKFYLLIILSFLIMLGGCSFNVNTKPTMYFFLGDHSLYQEVDNGFYIIDSNDKLLEIKQTIEIDESVDDGRFHKSLKSHYKYNEIGFVYQTENDYEYLFDSSNIDEWFKSKNLILCRVTTTASGYKARTTIKYKNEVSLISLNYFNNFSGPGDDEIKTYHFFLVFDKDKLDGISVMLDEEVYELKPHI